MFDVYMANEALKDVLSGWLAQGRREAQHPGGESSADFTETPAAAETSERQARLDVEDRSTPADLCSASAYVVVDDSIHFEHL